MVKASEDVHLAVDGAGEGVRLRADGCCRGEIAGQNIVAIHIINLTRRMNNEGRRKDTFG